MAWKRIVGMAIVSLTAAGGLVATPAAAPHAYEGAAPVCTAGYVVWQALPGPTCAGPCPGIDIGPVTVAPLVSVRTCADV